MFTHMPKKKSIILCHGFFEPEVMALMRRYTSKTFFVMEGRPTLASGRQTCQALMEKGHVPVIITDNMPGILFYKECVHSVRLTYQTLGADGALCLTGALTLGILAKKHKIPVYAYPTEHEVAPLAAPREVLRFNGVKTAAPGIKGYAPQLEWVPKKYITEIYSFAEGA